MFCRVFGGCCSGIEGRIVRVEADAGGGLPTLHILGEVSAEIREAGPRIRAAIKNAGFSMPPKRYLVNLAPAGFRKFGTGFDLPVAIALLCCIEQISPELLENSIFIGELSLNGNLMPVKGILPVVSQAAEEGFRHCFVPEANVREARIVSGIKVYGVETLGAVIHHLQGIHRLEEAAFLIEETGKQGAEFSLDFSEITGQAIGKRCVEIAVAGWHHLLMLGPPGSGKTMIAERIPGVMPPMSWEERMEVTKIYSASGRLKPGEGQIWERPFRRPHHSVSDKALIGGGIVPAAGELSLSHGGVLFMDEFAEFSRSALEGLRQPLEMGGVWIHRLRGVYFFPARPLLVAAMNPCKCGYYPDRERCRCTSAQIQNYMGRISGPIIERLDLCVSLQRMSYPDLEGREGELGSKQMRETIEIARERQAHRFRGLEIRYNGEMDSGMTRRFCSVNREGQELLRRIYEGFHLSARSLQKILKVARTISDLEDTADISVQHLAEAAGYRLPDERYGGNLWS